MNKMNVTFWVGQPVDFLYSDDYNLFGVHSLLQGGEWTLVSFGCYLLNSIFTNVEVVGK